MLFFCFTHIVYLIRFSSFLLSRFFFCKHEFLAKKIVQLEVFGFLKTRKWVYGVCMSILQLKVQVSVRKITNVATFFFLEED